MTVLLQIGRRPPDEPPPPPTGPPTASSQLRVFRSSTGRHLFVVDGSRVYDLPAEVADQAEAWLACGLEIHDPEAAPAQIAALIPGWSPDSPGSARIDGRPLAPPPLASLSLNVMQSCNMSCGYCYADEGKFGGRAQTMHEPVAIAAVDRLITESAPGADLVLGFMGGEPLLASALVHRITRYAAEAAGASGRTVRFALTTNLTTVTADDARLFAEFPFTVSVSLDGPAAVQDPVRRMRDGSSSYDRLRAGLDVLNQHGRPRHLGARVTVTSGSGPLLPILEHGIELGFDEVGFGAVLVSPDPALALQAADIPVLLERMIACGEVALRELSAGRQYPFGNFETAMHQIHRGSHRPYPCGAGAAYLSADAKGDLYACHRLVGDQAYAMGSVTGGSDHAARSQHLAASHVDGMQPCQSCWARYLCGGGCYHEVSRRGRVGCDYIRGWLDFCLRAYVELYDARPEYFEQPGTATSDLTTVAR